MAVPLVKLPGNINGNDFFLMAEGDTLEQQIRFHSNSIQLLINSIVMVIFVDHTLRALAMLYRSKRNICAWCCLVQSGTGVIYGLVSFAYIVPGGGTCTMGVIMHGIGILASSVCVHVVLLRKAWLAHNRDRRLLLGGIMLLLPLPVPLYIIVARSEFYVTNVAACIFVFPDYFPWLKFGIEIPINALMSTAFLTVVLQQYRQFRSETWRMLARDGVYYMFAMIASNFTCSFIAATGLVGSFSDMFFIMDWVISSMLLLRQQRLIQLAIHSSKNRQPKTNLKALETLPVSKTHNYYELESN